MKKIRKEVELMGSIQDCGNVVGLHGVYEDDAQVYVVMELCSGGDLERVLEVGCSCHPYAGLLLPVNGFDVLSISPCIRQRTRPSWHLCTVQERGPFNELQTALVLYECLKVIASCHVSNPFFLVVMSIKNLALHRDCSSTEGVLGCDVL